jgi:hypothetical protein
LIKIYLLIVLVVGSGFLIWFAPALFAVIAILASLVLGYWYLIRPRLHRNVPRIRHGLLKGHLISRYGETEGRKLYQSVVETLRKRGYR